MYVWGLGHNPAPAPRPTMIYCTSLLINTLLFLHFEALNTFSSTRWRHTATESCTYICCVLCQVVMMDTKIVLVSRAQGASLSGCEIGGKEIELRHWDYWVQVSSVQSLKRRPSVIWDFMCAVAKWYLERDIIAALKSTARKRIVKTLQKNSHCWELLRILVTADWDDLVWSDL
jgi:hypothetical protein